MFFRHQSLETAAITAEHGLAHRRRCFAGLSDPADNNRFLAFRAWNRPAFIFLMNAPGEATVATVKNHQPYLYACSILHIRQVRHLNARFQESFKKAIQFIGIWAVFFNASCEWMNYNRSTEICIPQFIISLFNLNLPQRHATLIYMKRESSSLPRILPKSYAYVA